MEDCKVEVHRISLQPGIYHNIFHLDPRCARFKVVTVL